MTLIRGTLNSDEPLPVSPDQVTVEWCSKALGFAVKEFTTIETIHGTASKILIGLKTSSSNGGTADPKPDQICVKGGFDPAIIAIYPGLNAIYRREAEFYYYIAPLVAMRLPKAWLHLRDPLEPWPVSRVRAGVEQLAALHAATWSKTAQDFPWLASGSALPAVILALLEPEAWARRYAEGERPPVPDEMLDRERMRQAFQKLWSVTDPRYNCLVHGDAHIGNTYITAAGEPGFIDWQGLAVGSAFDDVPYFITGALTVQDRREHEVGLVEHYLDSLAALGGPRLRREEVWDEYRRHMMHGFVWALTDPHMQPKDVIFAMVERYTAAMVDHGTLALLGC
ncbi:hypothetical protein PG993_002558 [Apiospora rasikravindrae]|uniref:CHK kinase-like domain-containing protein n=1 Tax=Apiospora rasikravindrae TaxID=990691 RepID=A0ABR1TX83_9PEZI